MRNIVSYYSVLVVVGVLVPSIVFLFLGYAASRAVTSQTQAQVANVIIGFLTVDGVLLGLSTRFREAFGTSVAGRWQANALEALQVSVLTVSLLWSLVTILYASFSNDVSLVSAWFQSSIVAFYFAIAIYSSFAILSRKEHKPASSQVLPNRDESLKDVHGSKPVEATTQGGTKLKATNLAKFRFIYENWAVLATGIALFGLAVMIQASLWYPATKLRVYLLWGIALLGILAIVRPLLGILAGVYLPSGPESQSTESYDQLYLEDWKMTKDRIKHFDDMVIRIRTQGVPVATAILAAAFIASPTLKSIQVDLSLIKVSSLSLVFGASALLITAIGLLDMLHYNLLLLAVNHALDLENRPEFKRRLQITHKLTSPLLTFAHSLAAAAIYLSVAGAAIYLAFLFR